MEEEFLLGFSLAHDRLDCLVRAAHVVRKKCLLVSDCERFDAHFAASCQVLLAAEQELHNMCDATTTLPIRESSCWNGLSGKNAKQFIACDLVNALLADLIVDAPLRCEGREGEYDFSRVNAKRIVGRLVWETVRTLAQELALVEQHVGQVGNEYCKRHFVSLMRSLADWFDGICVCRFEALAYLDRFESLAWDYALPDGEQEAQLFFTLTWVMHEYTKLDPGGRFTHRMFGVERSLFDANDYYDVHAAQAVTDQYLATQLMCSDSLSRGESIMPQQPELSNLLLQVLRAIFGNHKLNCTSDATSVAAVGKQLPVASGNSDGPVRSINETCRQWLQKPGLLAKCDVDSFVLLVSLCREMKLSYNQRASVALYVGRMQGFPSCSQLLPLLSSLAVLACNGRNTLADLVLRLTQDDEG